MAECERPRCTKKCDGDLLYCSERCFQMNNDPNPIQPMASLEGLGMARRVPRPVVLNRTLAPMDSGTEEVDQ